MKIERFEDIIAWQKARELTLHIYRHFENFRDFSFKDQTIRASISIMNNIAEGFERRTNHEFRYFLYVAKGSCGEVRSMLLLADDLGKVTSEESRKLISISEEISRLLSGLIKTL